MVVGSWAIWMMRLRRELAVPRFEIIFCLFFHYLTTTTQGSFHIPKADEREV